MFSKNKLKKVLFIEKDTEFWSFSDALDFFHDISKDLTIKELEKLIEIMQFRLNLKKCLPVKNNDERVD